MARQSRAICRELLFVSFTGAKDLTAVGLVDLLSQVWATDIFGDQLILVDIVMRYE